MVALGRHKACPHGPDRDMHAQPVSKGDSLLPGGRQPPQSPFAEGGGRASPPFPKGDLGGFETGFARLPLRCPDDSCLVGMQASEVTNPHGPPSPGEVARRPADVAEHPVSPAREWRHRHVLDLYDFSRQEIETVLDTARGMKEVLGREIRRVPTLRGKTVVTAFYEASTRTRVSFELAAKNLSADVASISAQASSVEKGESLLDTMRTLKALGADVIVMRHWQSGAPYLVSQRIQANVINAGDGAHAHPTQALLDLFTIRERLGRVEGLKVVILGDISYSRVARSNVWGLTAMGARVVLCGPPTLLPVAWQRAFPCISVETDLGTALESADVVMPLRLQKERQEAGLLPSMAEYVRLYQLNAERLSLARPGALVLHPGPMNEGIEISPEVAHGAQSAIQEQVTNGVAVRMALLYLLARGGHAAD